MRWALWAIGGLAAFLGFRLFFGGRGGTTTRTLTTPTTPPGGRRAGTPVEPLAGMLPPDPTRPTTHFGATGEGAALDAYNRGARGDAPEPACALTDPACWGRRFAPAAPSGAPPLTVDPATKTLNPEAPGGVFDYSNGGRLRFNFKGLG